MADFYKALSEGVSEQELRKIFEDELAAAKAQLSRDERQAELDEARGYFIDELINYFGILVDDPVKDNDYNRIYNMIEEWIKPFEDLIVSLDIKHLSNEELERAILELLNK